ncbi:MAG: hypothetical protein IJZ72_02870 [Oscillospiraceae bacterium]|nr:hypothetical protein [Oscillospiraceae bacterium]
MGKILYEMHFVFEPVLLVPVVMFAATFFFPQAVSSRDENADLTYIKKFCTFARWFIAVLTVIAAAAQISMYTEISDAYKNGDYLTVEGVVENFRTGQKKESFAINDVDFSYSDNNIIQGYHRMKQSGGVIKGDGQHLRVGYVYYNDTYGNIIVYIEELS